MGTRWRGVLAPINRPTGDGRRMAVGALTHRPLPLPLRWQRTETNGHNEAVTIGTIDTLRIDNEAGHVWGEGELFDDISPATNPRLAEDVKEVMYLTGKQTIGPSVDPGAATAVAVVAGTDKPLTDQQAFEVMVGQAKPPAMETLFTAYEIAGATLVPIPAFSECRPIELMDATIPAAMSADVVPDDVTARVALLAAAGLGTPPVELFMDPRLSQITPMTRVERPDGWVHVFGHVAEHQTCLVGRRDMCLTPPYSEREYSSFHRYHSTDDGQFEFPLPLGRLTAGFGSLENTCRCCPGNDDHACANISFGAAVAHHDRMQALAFVRVGEDEDNGAIWFSGVEAPGVDERGRALLRRQKISGDWREVAGSMELTEVLVLNRRNPGFPLPRGASRGGRQRALTAAGVVVVPLAEQVPGAAVDVPAAVADDGAANSRISGEGLMALDYDRIGEQVAFNLAAMAAGVRTGWTSMPVAPDDRPWDKGEAIQRLVAWAGDDIAGKYARAFLWRDPDGDPGLQGTYKLPIADVIDGRLTVVPNAVRNAAARLDQVDGLGPDAQAQIRGVLDRLMDRIHGEDDDTQFGFNKNQRRGPDGRWINMGGDGSATRGRGSEGGGAGAGGDRPSDATETQRRSDIAELRDYTRKLRDAGEGRTADLVDAEIDSYEQAVDEGDERTIQGRTAFINGTLWTARNRPPRKPRKAKQQDAQQRAARDAYNEEILDEAEGAQETNQEEDDFDEDLQGLIQDVLEAQVEGGAAYDAAVDRLRAALETSYMDSSELPSPPGGMTAAAAEGGHTGGMIALRMSDADAQRLAITGGLPPEELHMTLRYLGDADRVGPETRQRMADDLAKYAASVQPFQADAFALNMFNPGTANDREPALVLGMSGDALAPVHQAVNEMAWDGYEDPGQHSPWHSHVTLMQPAGEQRDAAYYDRMGPMTFDRLRLAFGPDVIDLPLGAPPGGPITQVGGGYDIDSNESMMATRARAAAAAVQAALGDSNTN